MKITHDRSSGTSRCKATILIVGPTPPPYIGPSVATKIILESELKDRFNLLYLDTSDRRSPANIGVIDLRNLYLAFIQLFHFFLLLVNSSPRIVYIPICQTIIGYLRDAVFIILSKIFGARVIIHLRGGYFRRLYEQQQKPIKFIIRNSLKLVSRAIVLGRSLRYIFEGLVPAELITVVPNGISADYITNAELERALSTRHYASETRHKIQSTGHKTNESNQKVLFLSNLILSKGFFDVIKAIPMIITQKSNILPHQLCHSGLGSLNSSSVEFIFAGAICEEPRKCQQVLDYLDKHSLNSYVQFIGASKGTKKKALLLTSDIFVFPTHYHAEGQPWVIIEAMAAGLPIISTDQGGIKEMVIDGENGFIVEKQNPAQIAEKIVYLLENAELRSKMGKKSRERFLKYYTKDKFIGQLAKVFNEVIAD